MPLKMKPNSVIIAQLGINSGGSAHRFFTNTCYKRMDKYVPMDNGDLRTIVDIGTDYIKYEVPYARYQYYGVRDDGTHVVHNYTTPGTGTYWDKRMWSAEKESVVSEVANYVRKRGR